MKEFIDWIRKKIKCSVSSLPCLPWSPLALEMNVFGIHFVWCQVLGLTLSKRHVNIFSINTVLFCMYLFSANPVDYHQGDQKDIQKYSQLCWLLEISNLTDVVLYKLPDCWLEISIQEVSILRPATSAQVFLGIPVSISECWDGSQDSHVATACFSCSPPDLNFLNPYFIFLLSLFSIYVYA
jgi:hypothetical protein